MFTEHVDRFTMITSLYLEFISSCDPFFCVRVRLLFFSKIKKDLPVLFAYILSTSLMLKLKSTPNLYHSLFNKNICHNWL